MDHNAGETLGEGADLAEPLWWAHRPDLHLLRREAEGLLAEDPVSVP